MGMRDLGTVPGVGGTGTEDTSFAYDINDAGQVGGSSYTAGGARHAFSTGSNGVSIRS